MKSAPDSTFRTFRPVFLNISMKQQTKINIIPKEKSANVFLFIVNQQNHIDSIKVR